MSGHDMEAGHCWAFPALVAVGSHSDDSTSDPMMALAPSVLTFRSELLVIGQSPLFLGDSVWRMSL